MDPTTPTWRRGWTWTAIKCFTLTAALMGLGALALHLLLGTVVPPWYIPKPVFEWLMENVRPYALPPAGGGRGGGGGGGGGGEAGW
ncbi:MAG: hypothetical protein IPF99_36900 [Deltaproteobacteria bacterium]|nr:hypothetical protein [Deltaproteobacteria bacterium]